MSAERVNMQGVNETPTKRVDADGVNETPTKRVDADGLAAFVRHIADTHPLESVTFLCIGTDRSSGDCLGPWVGTLLAEKGVRNVVGTLQQPCDADALPCVVANLPNDGPIVAIDACLGQANMIGKYAVTAGPLTPAKSVGKPFPPIGAYSIAAIVNAYGPKPYWTIQSTSVYLVMNMAREITDTIVAIWRS